MQRAMFVALATLAFIPLAYAQPERGRAAEPQTETITDPDAIAARLRFWAQDSGDPVYYGEVRNVDARSRRVLGHYQCLAIAFIRSARVGLRRAVSNLSYQALPRRSIRSQSSLATTASAFSRGTFGVGKSM